MLLRIITLTYLILSITSVQTASIFPRSQCKPFHSTFPASDVSRHGSDDGAPFTAISPEGTYTVNKDGLVLYLQKPRGTIKTKDGINNIVSDGATINSTFTLLHGKVTYEVSAPTVAGVVTAAILIADEHDEMDIELLGGDTSHWQTNVFAPNPKDQQTLWGVFGEIENYASSAKSKPSVASLHNYTIDWNAERIIWSVDNHVMRTLQKSDTVINGTLHYPTHPTRIQLGIWDASNPIGTSEWAKGPIKWDSAPSRMSATFRSITVEC